MTEQFRDAPIFDADQHMYETAAALKKFLPEKYSSLPLNPPSTASAKTKACW